METIKEKKTCFILFVNIEDTLNNMVGECVDCVAQTPEALESRIDVLKNNETEFLKWYFEDAEPPIKDVSQYKISCEIMEVPMITNGGLSSWDKTRENNMLALQEFVTRIANDDYCDHGSRMLFDAKELIAKLG